MWGFLLLIILVLILLLLFAIYIVKCSHNLIQQYVDNKVVSWLLSFVPLLLFLFGMRINMVNAIVVDVHLIVFIVFTKIVLYIIQKVTKKKFNESWVLGIGILVTTIVMVHAYYLAHHVVETDYTVNTTKDIGTEKFRMIQISDSHLGATMNGKQFSEYLQEINQLHPDIVVVTGDFVDDDTSYEDMVEGAAGLGNLRTKYGVYFVYGNHDKGYFRQRNYQDEDIRRELKKNHVIILEDTVVNLTDNIILIGRQDASVKTRANAVELTKGIDENKFIITLDHQPNDYVEEMKSQMDLVLSGHTHGGQFIPIGELSVLLGINDKFYGMEKRDNTTFIVNAGISDWAIKFKTGTVSEFVVVDVVKK